MLARAKATDEAEVNEPELDLPAEIERREVRLAAIREARERLEQRQREADLERGRSDDDDRRPRDPDGKPKGGRYKREFGVPEDKAQDNFTDPDSRIMKRAGGGFDPATTRRRQWTRPRTSSWRPNWTTWRRDANWLLPMLQAVKDNLGELPAHGAGRCGLPQRRQPEELPAASRWWWRWAAKASSTPRSTPSKNPHTAAMAAKLQTEKDKAAYRKRKWIAEPPNGWIKNVLGFRQFSLRGLHRVRAEWKLVCMALNLRRMGSLKAA